MGLKLKFIVVEASSYLYMKKNLLRTDLYLNNVAGARNYLYIKKSCPRLKLTST
jgi:hypothetical protein